MNIIIIGGGNLGRHVASILSKEGHNITIIDKNPKVISEISAHLDVATKQGCGTDWQVLNELLEFNPDLLLALTGSDEVNIISSTIAKHLNYPRTITRVRNDRFFNSTRLDFSHIFDIDYFICPELLVANDIMKYVTNPGSLAVEHFAHGALQLRTLLIPPTWKTSKDTTLKHFDLPEGIIVGLIRREVVEEDGARVKKVIFPHGQDKILPGDEVTFIGITEAVAEIPELFDIPYAEEIHAVTLAGGSVTAQHLARLLVKTGIDVRIIDINYDRCTLLTDLLPECTIVHHDATDIEFLRSEKIDLSDIFIACTNNDATNILSGLLSQEAGCKEIMLVVSNNSYIPMVSKLGFKHVVSPRTSATNQILSQLLSGKINSLISLYENQAEVMEITVSNRSKIVGIPLSELGPFLPRDLLIVMIQNRGRIMIAHGNRIISPGDTVIVVTTPIHIEELERIF